ncbi:MAG: NAD(P)/FAD-dependent oxidoreductase [Rhodothermales bacterium]
MKHIAIIGNGVAGITAARTIRKLQPDWRLSVVSAETDHFFSRTALMYIYMGHLKYEDTKPYEDWFWAKNRIELVRGYVTRIDTQGKALQLGDGQRLDYDVLVLAVGSQFNRFGWPGDDLPGVQGLVSYPDLQLMEENTRGVDRAVVVGGGLIGIEMTEMLHSRGIHVTFLVREDAYMSYLFPKEESELIHRQIRRSGIDLRLGTEVDRIEAGPNGRANAVVTGQGERIPCGFVGLTVGVRPNLTVTKSTDVETDRGILVDEYFETNLPGVYAIGDCAEFRTPLPGRKSVEQLWYTARMHGETVGLTIAGKRTAYDPGVFFNSAKFFDLEYQTYGHVPPKLPESQETLYWEHPDHTRSIRISYDRDSGAVLGFNLMGVRYRHDICAGWISQRASIHEVLPELGQANFDPEFFRQFEKEVVAAYNREAEGDSLQLRRRRGLVQAEVAV